MNLISSEDPKEHWKYLQCNNEIVIDFGCAYNDTDKDKTRENKLGTPHYIISQNPKEYIGVDIYEPDLNEFMNEFPEATFLNISIDSSEKVQNLFDKYLPTIIKSDIEGAEFYFLNTTPPDSLKQIAIETHSQDIEDSFIKWAESFGFSVKLIEALAEHPHIKIIYFTR
jgi:hypothetical protein